jgi:phosphomannomutase/phosphoglucomutase
MEVNKYIFREYDIRGIAGIDGVKFEPKIIEEYEKWYGPFPGITINLKVSKAIGKGYGTIIKKLGGRKVVVGFEVRPYADELKKAFVEGITETGVNVVDIGRTTTPLVYFLTSYQNYDGGVNITGSHNIYFYNGFKLVKKNSAPLYGEGLQKLYRIIINEDFDIARTRGEIKRLFNPYKIYKKYVLEHIKVKRKLKIVVDCGNGTAGLYAVDFLKSLGCDVVEGLYLEPNPYFPHHVPDPEAPCNLEDLSKEVRKRKADLGIAFDADGDRVGFVDEKGNFIFADETLLILAKNILERNKGKKILFDVKCTQLLLEMLPQFGGIPLMHRTGHGPIKDTLRKDPEIILAGEVSGHFFFVKDYFKIDDAFWAAANVLKLLSEFDGTFSSMFAFIPKRVRTPEIKLPCEDRTKFKVVEKITEEFSKRYKVISLDGARIMFGSSSWGLIRASNTAPYLTVRVESVSEKRAIEIKNVLADTLEKYPEVRGKLDRKHVYSLTGRLGYI